MRRTVLLAGAILVFAMVLQAQTNPPKVVDRIVAQVNDDIITLSDLNREMGEVRQELAQKYSGEQLAAAVQKAEKDAIENLVREKLCLQKATELGIGSGIEPQVSAEIERVRQANKIKDMDEFERALEQQGLTMTSYREYVRKQVIVGTLIGEFVDSRITLLSEEVERYYKSHSKDYESPEEVTLSEIFLPAGLTDGQVASQMNDLRARLLKGESFATLASQYSKGPTAGKGGSIGSFQVAKLDPQISSAITSVKEGEVSPVVKTTDGYALFRVDGRKPAALRPLEDVRNDIKQLLYAQKRAPELERFFEQLKEDAYIQYFDEIK